MRFETEFKSASEYKNEYDLVVATDGINSLVRREYADIFKPDIDTRLCKFVWLGTKQKFDDAYTEWLRELRARAYVEMREAPL